MDLRRPAPSPSIKNEPARPRPTHSRCTATLPLPSPGQPPKVALLFDCDGVIVETEELHRLAYNGAFEAFGLKIDGAPIVWDTAYYDKLQNTVGGGKPKMKWHFTTTTGGRWPDVTAGPLAMPAPQDEVRFSKRCHKWSQMGVVGW